MAEKNPIKICLASSEFAPFAKTGGLADVCAALSAYLHRQGHDVRVLLPLYRRIQQSDLEFSKLRGCQDIPIRLGSHNVRYSIDEAQLPDSSQRIYFLRCPALYDRDGIYGGGDDEHFRFILLSRAAIEVCQRLGFAPDVIHCHDWHTASIPLYLKTVYAWDRLFSRTRTVLTIHNIGYQGIFGAERVGDLGLNGGEHELHQDDLSAGKINLLKTGVLHADVLTTVSPTYAREIQSDEYGMGLQDLIRARRESTFGILNGVDYDDWDPQNDALIPHPYSAKNLAGKRENKKALMQELGLSGRIDKPLIGMVSRLTSQKGIDLIESVMPRVLRSRNFAFAVLGSGEPRYEEFFSRLQKNFRGRVCYYQGHNNKLAHWIEAGADMFLMPSLFEPCGLNQMYSLRYGTVPIVRATGGLADTVELFDPATGSGTGIVFRDYDEPALDWALNTALDLFQDRKTWSKIMKNGMSKDFSWERQGSHYVDLFRKICR
ncbi:MAG: glycogen synthase [Woeseiaceae bacterium]|nr:glycogen synthase [Woeseiaceae bacterium]